MVNFVLGRSSMDPLGKSLGGLHNRSTCDEEEKPLGTGFNRPACDLTTSQKFQLTFDPNAYCSTCILLTHIHLIYLTTFYQLQKLYLLNVTGKNIHYYFRICKNELKKTKKNFSTAGSGTWILLKNR
jgi:hypothetical protein